MSKKVIIFDDDHGPIDLYVKALRLRGFVVTHIDTLGAAFDHIRDAAGPADFYIVDMMLPIANTPQEHIKKEDYRDVGYGLTAGLVLLKRLREWLPSVPVLMLTSVSRPDILSRIPGDDNCRIEAKVNMLPFDLADHITKRLVQ